MAASPSWPKDASRLEAVADRCDIGLHLVLTELAPLGPMPMLNPSRAPLTLVRLFARLPKASVEEIAREFERQLDAFEEALGRPPDFIDGHQHVHVLPRARDALLALFASGRLRSDLTYVRDCYEAPRAILRRGIAPAKALLLSALALPLSRRLRAAGIPSNDSFRGVSGFEVGAPVGPIFRGFFEGPGARPLVMCHPGLPDSHAKDPIAERRPEEFDYLVSERLPRDLDATRASIARFGGRERGVER